MRSGMIYEGLQEEIAQLARRRIRAALLLCDGNKTQAAEILGLSRYQTLTNWMGRYDIRIADIKD